MYCSVIVVNTVFEVKCQNSLTPLLAACFKALVTVLNDPNVSLMHRWCQHYIPERSAELVFTWQNGYFQDLGVVTDM